MPQVGETVNSWTNRSGGEKCLVANSKLETDGYIKQRRTNKQTMGLKQREQRQHTTVCSRHYHHHRCFWLRWDVLSEQIKCCLCLHSFVRIPSRAAQTTMSVTKVLTIGLLLGATSPHPTLISNQHSCDILAPNSWISFSKICLNIPTFRVDNPKQFNSHLALLEICWRSFC